MLPIIKIIVYFLFKESLFSSSAVQLSSALKLNLFRTVLKYIHGHPTLMSPENLASLYRRLLGDELPAFCSQSMLCDAKTRGSKDTLPQTQHPTTD